MNGGVPFGSWLKQRRRERGVGPDELADEIGCSRITLLKIEAGDRRPSRQMALLLAEGLGIPEDEHEAFVTFARAAQPVAPSKEASGVGTRGIHTQESPDVAARVPWREAHLHRTNLPHVLTPIIGREKEIEEARAILSQPRVRLLTLTGAPGIGKTRLALQVASLLVEQFEDGVFLVELATVDDPDLILSSIARTFSLTENIEMSIEQKLFEHLRGQRILLVLDNLEHLLDATPDIVRLLEGCPWLKVLVTSREALHVRGERRYIVTPLEVPGPRFQLRGDGFAAAGLKSPRMRDIWKGELSRVPSVALFVERAQSADPDFVLSESNGADVAAVVSGLDGLPLAIELAAARAGQLSPREMQNALSNGLALGKEGGRDLPPRQRTLRASIEWSYNLLNEDERTLFSRLGVFVGGFTLSAAVALGDTTGASDGNAQSTGADVEVVGEILFSLTEKNLVRLSKRGTPENSDDEDRYGLLEAIREYAQYRLASGGEQEAIRLRHAQYYVALAEEARRNQRGPRQLSLLARMDAEYSNVMAALNWLLPSEKIDKVELAARMAFALYPYWVMRGYFSEGRAWQIKALEKGERLLWRRTTADPTSAPAEADPTLSRLHFKLLNDAGLLAWNQSDNAAAQRFFESALELVREARDKPAMSSILNNLAILETEQGRYERSIKMYEQVLEIEQEAGPSVYVPLTMNNLGVAYWDSGNVSKARELYEASLALYRNMEDPSNMVLALDNLGIATAHDGDYAASRQYQEEALAICRTLRNVDSLAHVLTNMASRAISEGDYAAAREYYAEVLPLLEQQGYRRVITKCLQDVASWSYEEGRLLDAAKLWGAAEAMRETDKYAMAVTGIEGYRQDVASAREQAGAEAFQAAWDEGRMMSLQEALALIKRLAT